MGMKILGHIRKLLKQGESACEVLGLMPGRKHSNVSCFFFSFSKLTVQSWGDLSVKKPVVLFNPLRNLEDNS